MERISIQIRGGVPMVVIERGNCGLQTSVVEFAHIALQKHAIHVVAIGTVAGGQVLVNAYRGTGRHKIHGTGERMPLSPNSILAERGIDFLRVAFSLFDGRALLTAPTPRGGEAFFEYWSD